MFSYKNLLTAITFCSSTILLTACGGGGNSTPTPDNKPQPFQSSFSSTLTIVEKSTNGLKTYDIPSKSTNEKDHVLAYSVITELANSMETFTGHASIRYPLLNQVIKFALGENANSFNLEISYDPLLKQVNFYTLTKNNVDSDGVEQTFFCRQADSVYDETCGGSTVNYDPTNGTVDVNFTQSTFKSNNSLDSLLILNGKLKGKLSIPPQTVQDIPKTSHGSVTIDGRTHQVIAAVNTPEQIIGSRIFNAGISVLTDNGVNISFSKDNKGLYSQYIDSHEDFLSAQPTDTQNLTFKDLPSASQFILAPTLFNFSGFGNQPVPPSLIIGASVDALKPKQVLTFRPLPSNSPADENNRWYADKSYFNQSTVPNDFNVSVINHDTVTIESQDVRVTIQNKKLKSIQLNRILYDYSSGSLMGLTTIDYQCGEANFACKGVQVEPNGFGVKFNNAVLTNSSPYNNDLDDSLPPNITLNGGLVYLGR